MKEVTHEEFYRAIGTQDVVLKVVGNFPYTTHFKLRYGRKIGEAVDSYTGNIPRNYPIVTKYFLDKPVGE